MKAIDEAFINSEFAPEQSDHCFINNYLDIVTNPGRTTLGSITDHNSTTPASIPIQSKTTHEIITNKGRTTPVSITNLGRTLPVNITKQGSPFPESITKQGNTEPADITNQDRTVPKNITNQDIITPVSTTNQDMTTPARITNKDMTTPSNVINQRRSNMNGNDLTEEVTTDVADENSCDIPTASDNKMVYLYNDARSEVLESKENIQKDPLNSFSLEDIEKMKKRAVLPGAISVKIKRDKSIERRILHSTPKNLTLPLKESPAKKRKISCDLLLDLNKKIISSTKKTKTSVAKKEKSHVPGQNKGRTGKVEFFQMHCLVRFGLMIQLAHFQVIKMKLFLVTCMTRYWDLKNKGLQKLICVSFI